ncbi:MAG: ABC transporter ATP-binding protein [Armatimonadetes bacterium]|nr:ABC transporter ATP-binding protein [Armatimonadota bacterium]
METLLLQNLGRRYGRRWAVRGINLSVEEGEMIAVWGTSGSGKTTLLHLLATLLRPSEGHAWVDNHDLLKRPSRVRSAVSLGFQTPTLDPQLTLLEGLDLRAAMQGVPRAHRTNRIIQQLHLLGLEEYRDTPIGILSASRRRRAEVVAALLPVPRILLLDEPFQGMDDETASRVWEHLIEMRSRERVTLLFSTDRADMAERCHRIALLNEGRFLACDTPDILRGAAGNDVVTVKPIDERLTARRLHERLQVKVSEEPDGFRMEVQRGDGVAADILGSFGGQTAAIYVRRPSLEAGIRRIMDGTAKTDGMDAFFEEALSET